MQAVVDSSDTTSSGGGGAGSAGSGGSGAGGGAGGGSGGGFKASFISLVKGCCSLGSLYTLFLALAMLTTGTINTIGMFM